MVEYSTLLRRQRAKKSLTGKCRRGLEDVVGENECRRAGSKGVKSILGIMFPDEQASERAQAMPRRMSNVSEL